MIKIKIFDNTFNLTNRTALKLLSTLQNDLSAHLSTHCVECDSILTNANKGIPYQTIDPSQSGYICEQCANRILNIEFTVEDINNCD